MCEGDIGSVISMLGLGIVYMIIDAEEKGLITPRKEYFTLLHDGY
uniref:Uncharacterized protein n=1 Tax=Nelumbo nucifera TaxID=4432 RepID=A0A822Y7Y4_NELNU|nr:TPA_asm: hypothetical protein HUJ06_028603 [Nelumbo nucifera]